MAPNIARILVCIACLSCSIWAQSQSCIAPPPGMVAWYPGDGNANDLLGVNNGVLQNGATFAPGKVGPAFSFNGSNQFVALPRSFLAYPTQGNTSTTPLSVDAWFQTTKGGVILGQQSDVGPPAVPTGFVPAIYVGMDGMLYAELFWGGMSPVSSAPRQVNDGAFHHVAVTYDGATELLYLDGTLIGAQPLTETGYASSYQYQLGTGFTQNWPGGNGGYFYFQGLIDEVEFFNRALSGTEVQAIFNAGSAGKCKNLPPVAKCQNVTVPAGAGGTASASIDNGSFSPIPGNTITLAQAPPGPYSLGNTLVTLTVTDNRGVSSQCTGTVTVAGTTPSPCGSLTASPSVLWPANNQMVPVTVTGSPASSCTAAGCKIISVRSNEGGDGEDDDQPDWVITGNLTVNLRAARSGQGSGRIYTLTVRCVDASGAASEKTVTVTVPHDQGNQDNNNGDQNDNHHGGGNG